MEIPVFHSKLWSNGTKAHECHTINGTIEGMYNSWHESGGRSVSEFYQDGKLKGERKVWFENGQLKFQTFHRDNNQEGESKEWYENGQLKFQTSHQDVKPGEESLGFHFYTNPYFQASYQGGQLEERELWYGNGIFYRDGKLECKSWYENGQIKMWLFYQGGKQEGERKWWYENGQLKEQFYRNGKLIDDQFTWKKKCIFKKLQKSFRTRMFWSVSSYIIFDLITII